MIETPRLTLRPYRPDDLAGLAAILTDGPTMAFWPRPFTLGEAQQWLEQSRALHQAFGWCRLAMVAKGQVIGDVGLSHLVLDGEPLIDLGWIVARAHWGQGLASEAAAAVRDHAFGALGLTLLHANMHGHHAASRRVAEKIGMVWQKNFANPRNRGLPTALYQISRGAG